MNFIQEDGYVWDGSTERIENAFDELYFALGAETEDEQQYIDDVVYNSTAQTMENVLDREFGTEDVPENIANLNAALYAQNLAETLRRDEETLEGFYDQNMEERVEYMAEIRKHWQWAGS